MTARLCGTRELPQPSAQAKGVTKRRVARATCEETYEITAGSAAAAPEAVAASSRKAQRARGLLEPPCALQPHAVNPPRPRPAARRKRGPQLSSAPDSEATLGPCVAPSVHSASATTIRTHSAARALPAAAPPTLRPPARAACTAPHLARGFRQSYLAMAHHRRRPPRAAPRAAACHGFDRANRRNATVGDEEGTRGARRRRRSTVSPPPPNEFDARAARRSAGALRRVGRCRRIGVARRAGRRGASLRRATSRGARRSERGHRPATAAERSRGTAPPRPTPTILRVRSARERSLLGAAPAADGRCCRPTAAVAAARARPTAGGRDSGEHQNARVGRHRKRAPSAQRRRPGAPPRLRSRCRRAAAKALGGRAGQGRRARRRRSARGAAPPRRYTPSAVRRAERLRRAACTRAVAAAAARRRRCGGAAARTSALVVMRGSARRSSALSRRAPSAPPPPPPPPLPLSSAPTHHASRAATGGALPPPPRRRRRRRRRRARRWRRGGR